MSLLRYGESGFVIVLAVAIARLSANEVRRIVDTARPHVPRHLRVGTDGTHASHHAVRHSGGDDLFRRDTLLDPLLKRCQRVPHIGPPGSRATAMPYIGQ